MSIKGFTQSERDLVVQHCNLIGKQIHVLLNQVNGRIYARHLDKLCKIANNLPYLAHEFECYPVVDELVRCPMCKKDIPSGEYDYYRACCHDCNQQIAKASA